MTVAWDIRVFLSNSEGHVGMDLPLKDSLVGWIQVVGFYHHWFRFDSHGFVCPYI